MLGQTPSRIGASSLNNLLFWDVTRVTTCVQAERTLIWEARDIPRKCSEKSILTMLNA